ncbi:MAG TPA: hypothetical protein VFT19_04825 [Solirubrobacterales bacterium]|nr:hypothetical protein [Solirubrobacterales bacterium]
MYKMRDEWTDERMDDFRGEVYRRFDGVDKRFDKVEGEIRDLRSEMKSGFDGLNARFDSFNGRFDGLQQTLLRIAGATIVTLIAAAAGIVATQL